VCDTISSEADILEVKKYAQQNLKCCIESISSMTDQTEEKTNDLKDELFANTELEEEE
jgi:hypothetical protein